MASLDVASFRDPQLGFYASTFEPPMLLKGDVLAYSKLTVVDVVRKASAARYPATMVDSWFKALHKKWVFKPWQLDTLTNEAMGSIGIPEDIISSIRRVLSQHKVEIEKNLPASRAQAHASSAPVQKSNMLGYGASARKQLTEALLSISGESKKTPIKVSPIKTLKRKPSSGGFSAFLERARFEHTSTGKGTKRTESAAALALLSVFDETSGLTEPSAKRRKKKKPTKTAKKRAFAKSL